MLSIRVLFKNYSGSALCVAFTIYPEIELNASGYK